MERLTVLSLGAGVQSTTLLLMSCNGVLPKLDAAVFADTGWEPPGVYAHLDWLTVECAANGIPVHRVGTGSLREDALRSKVRGVAEDGVRWASLPLYTRNGDGSVGMIRRQCSAEYKIAPVERFIRREFLGLAHGERAQADVVDKWLGISADELRRVRQSDNHWSRNVYPLVGIPDDMLPKPMTRLMCVNWLTTHYPGIDVPRSACIGCPFHSNREWRWIKARPALWADAVEFDAAIRHCGGMQGDMYLHRSCVPLAEANLDEDQATFWADECLGVCNT